MSLVYPQLASGAVAHFPLLRRRTRRVGNFEFRVTLPGDVRADDVEASLAHGVLTVNVPKAQATKHNKIDVTDSSSG